VFHLEARGELTSAIRAANPAHVASHPSGRPITVDSATYEQAFASEADKEGDVEGRYTKVHASDITWQSHGEQDVMFPAGAEEVASVHPDILVAKLAPGQVIHVEMHAVKGTGKTHAKWSPVSTAWYRLLPRITLSEEEPFYDAEAEDLVRCCPVGVFDIEDIGSGSGSAEAASTAAAKGKKGSKGSSSSSSGAGMDVEGPRKRGIVARPRDCTLCRECIRVPERGRRIRLEKISDHFICE
jgi:DNA-directed RNA polymerase I and III subunit RPAC1